MDKADLSVLSFTSELADPQDLNPVFNAFCVLVEVHLNYEAQAIVAGFKCWRSRDAYVAGKKPFEVIRVELSPTNGGAEFFAKNNIDGASLQLGPKLLEYLLTGNKLAQAKNSNPELKA